MSDFTVGAMLEVRKTIDVTTCLNSQFSFWLYCYLQDIILKPEVREVMGMTELEKLQAATDIADGLYFLHNHQKVSHWF